MQKDLCIGVSSKAFKNQAAPKHSPQKTWRKAPVLPTREECDRKFASPERHTPEPRINNDIFI